MDSETREALEKRARGYRFAPAHLSVEELAALLGELGRVESERDAALAACVRDTLAGAHASVTLTSLGAMIHMHPDRAEAVRNVLDFGRLALAHARPGETKP